MADTLAFARGLCGFEGSSRVFLHIGFAPSRESWFKEVDGQQTAIASDAMMSPAPGWHTPPCLRVAASPATAPPVVRPPCPVVGSTSSSSGSLQSDVTRVHPCVHPPVHPPVFTQAPRNWTPPRPGADAAFVQVCRWKPADSGAETARESGLQWLLRNPSPGPSPAPSNSFTERYSQRPWPAHDVMALRCLEPQQDFVAQRALGSEGPVPQDQSSSLDHAYRHSPSGPPYGEDAIAALAAGISGSANHVQSFNECSNSAVVKQNPAAGFFCSVSSTIALRFSKPGFSLIGVDVKLELIKPSPNPKP